MDKSVVAIVRYEKPFESVLKAVELSKGLKNMPPHPKVFIKPNIVFWTKVVDFPKWGVITTSRVVEDMVLILKEHGVDDITIGEGIVTPRPKDTETPAHAFESLGYNKLKKRYGVKVINVFERPFEKIDVGDGVEFNFNADIMHSDLVVNLPVLKTHAQTIVSLGIKNLKGTIDITSRKNSHNANPDTDLNFMISKLPNRMPPMFTLIDGIYSLERGPAYDGKARRTNLLIASSDILSADMVGAKVLGHEPFDIPYLVHAASSRGRLPDLSDVEIIGESIKDVASYHKYDFKYTEDGRLLLPLHRMGIKGLSYPKYDLTMCTYCSGINGVVLYAIANAWKGEPWDNVEVLTGKVMKPTPGMKKTILLGKCMYQANKDNPDINEMIAVKGCPPRPDDIVNALHKAGIMVDPSILQHMEMAPGLFMKRYEGKAEFDPAFFAVQ